MGDPSKASPTNMKTLLFALLVALAVADPEAKPAPDAEADPWYYYSRPTVYGGYTGLRPYGYAGYAGYGIYGRKKREAEAEPEADPYLLYAHSGVLPYHYNPVLKTEVKPVEEAETKTAEAVKPVVPLTYTYPYVPTVYNHHPLVYNTHLTYPYTYPIVPVVNKAETKKVEKREAEATPEADPEADPWLYSSGINRPYYAGYYGYRPYAGYYGGYRPYGYYGYGN